MKMTLSDPEEFESRNLEKDINEVVLGLPSEQKVFLLNQMRQSLERNEEEFTNILRQDEKMAQTFLSLQRDLKVDGSQQNSNRGAYFEEEPVRAQQDMDRMGGNRQMNRLMGGPYHHSMPGGNSYFNNKRVQPTVKHSVMHRNNRGNINPIGAFNQGGVQPSRRTQQPYFEDPNLGGPNLNGMQGMRGPERQNYYQPNEFDKQRQFGQNMNQPNMNKNKMYYNHNPNPNNRMY